MKSQKIGGLVCLDQLIRYIENQEEHHKTTRFRDEHRKLLGKHQIEYSKNYHE